LTRNNGKGHPVARIVRFRLKCDRSSASRVGA
jgi:hypothetical protein